MKKFINEFKAFISRGNVMDLAVGMIIGSAFTAIVTSLVKSILTPLINWIPGTGNTGALQTVLREAVVDTNGAVITEALILDWGAVISAIVTFLCTALVLFIIVRAFNKVKTAGEKAIDEIKKGKKKKKGESADEQPEETVEEPEQEKAETVEEPKESTEDLLKQIIAILQTDKKE